MTCQLLDQVLEWFKLFPNLLWRCDLGVYPSKKCHKNSASMSTQSVGVYARANYAENRYPGRRDSHGWSLWTTTTRATSPHTLILMWFRRDCDHLLNLYSRLPSQSRSLAFSLRASNHRPYSARL